MSLIFDEIQNSDRALNSLKYFCEDALRLVTEFVSYYNTTRLHSSIGYVAPVDKLLGKEEEIFKARDQKLHAARAERRRQREITPAVAEMKKHGAVTKYQIAT